MTSAQRSHYERNKAFLIAELEAKAERLQREWEETLKRIVTLEEESFDDVRAEAKIDEERDRV